MEKIEKLENVVMEVIEGIAKEPTPETIAAIPELAHVLIKLWGLN